MFRGMRRKRQVLPEAETIAMLRSCTSGVLAVHGDDDYPYAVPLSFAYEDGKLFFHSAMAGHKIDAIGRDDKASFCVIAADDVVQSTFTTHFRSAVVFGRVRLVTEDGEKRHALECLAKKYSPDHLEAAGRRDRARLEESVRDRARHRAPDRQGRDRDRQRARLDTAEGCADCLRPRLGHLTNVMPAGVRRGVS